MSNRIVLNTISHHGKGAIAENYVNHAVNVVAIGNPKDIVSGATRITRDSAGLVMASSAAKVIAASVRLSERRLLLPDRRRRRLPGGNSVSEGDHA